MNEALRLLDRLLKKQGYSIKKHPEYNLLPLKVFDGFSTQEKVYNAFNSKHQDKSANINKLEVCLRTCINEKRDKGNRSLFTGANLEDHLLTCINSLLGAINLAQMSGIEISLTIFDDRSDPSVIDKINSLCDNLNCDWKILTTSKAGQGESLLEHFSYAKDKDALFYFCEDDYLHDKTAICEMVGFYKKIYEQTGSHILIYPQEHDLIYNQINYPSYILLGENRRWRSMSNATHTFFIHSDVVNKYWKYFENTKYVGIKKKRHLGSEKKTTNLLFNHIAGFSPLPAVAVHLQKEVYLPPFFDWKKLWEEAKLN
jgi:hypothetical protein